MLTSSSVATLLVVVSTYMSRHSPPAENDVADLLSQAGAWPSLPQVIVFQWLPLLLVCSVWELTMSLLCHVRRRRSNSHSPRPQAKYNDERDTVVCDTSAVGNDSVDADVVMQTESSVHTENEMLDTLAGGCLEGDEGDHVHVDTELTKPKENTVALTVACDTNAAGNDSVDADVVMQTESSGHTENEMDTLAGGCLEGDESDRVHVDTELTKTEENTVALTVACDTNAIGNDSVDADFVMQTESSVHTENELSETLAGGCPEGDEGDHVHADTELTKPEENTVALTVACDTNAAGNGSVDADVVMQTESSGHTENEMLDTLAGGCLEGDEGDHVHVDTELTKIEENTAVLKSNLRQKASLLAVLQEKLQKRWDRYARILVQSCKETREALSAKEEAETEVKLLHVELSALRADLHAYQAELGKERAHSKHLRTALQLAQLKLISSEEDQVKSEGPQHFNIGSDDGNSETLTCSSSSTYSEHFAERKVSLGVHSFEGGCTIVCGKWRARSRKNDRSLGSLTCNAIEPVEAAVSCAGHAPSVNAPRRLQQQRVIEQAPHSARFWGAVVAKPPADGKIAVAVAPRDGKVTSSGVKGTTEGTTYLSKSGVDFTQRRQETARKQSNPHAATSSASSGGSSPRTDDSQGSWYSRHSPTDESTRAASSESGTRFSGAEDVFVDNVADRQASVSLKLGTCRDETEGAVSSRQQTGVHNGDQVQVVQTAISAFPRQTVASRIKQFERIASSVGSSPAGKQS